MRALLLVHKGAPSTGKLVAFLRAKGFEPFVLSSAVRDDAAFRAAMAELDVETAVSTDAALSVAEVLATARTVQDCRFCFTIRDGQRAAMAAANRELGAHDPSPEAIERCVDKHRMRHALAEAGLTALRSFRLDDPELRQRLDSGERHFVKPRRGVGSLCTRVVDSWAQVLDQMLAFANGRVASDGDDHLGEYYWDNELIAETFLDCRELSFEVIRQGGRTVLASEHERTVREFTAQTVLERGFASPPVRITPDEVAAARDLLDRALTALELDDGCYHVELGVGSDGRWEIIEVNPRPGGQYMVDSVQLQLDRSLGNDWIDVLTGVPVPPAGERTCGTYYQAHYLAPGRQVIGMRVNPAMPPPTMASGLLRTGQSARADREELGAMSLWRTELATHEQQARELAPQERVSFVYATGLRGRPLFLSFEPINHSYQVLHAADRAGFDVVAFHMWPILDSGPYLDCRESIALSVPLASWDDLDACFAEVLAVCGDRPVAGTYCAVELLLEFEARVQEHFGVPTKGVSTVHDVLDKLTARRRLVEAGLSGLRTFDREEAPALREWPVGERALYFKPVHGAGSVYVRRCESLDEVRNAMAEWAAASTAADRVAIPFLGRYLDLDDAAFFLEEEAPGELLSVEGWALRGEYTALGLTSRFVLGRDPTVEMGTGFPYEHPRRQEIVELVAAAHRALGITHGLTHTELMVPEHGPIELVELNLRFIGSDCLTQIELAYGAPVTDDLVAVLTGGTPQARPEPRRHTCLQHLMPPLGLDRLDSVELPDTEFVRPSYHLGSLTSTDRQIDQLATYIVSADDPAEAVRAALEVRRRTRVNGVELADDPNNLVLGPLVPVPVPAD
jgi:biotin carboxylase